MAIERREFLAALAVAPAALAACAGPSAASRAPASPGPGRAAQSGAPGGGALAAVRSFPLAAEAEPAFVFRAGVARPGEP
jgi:hypothetical protein